MEQYIIFDLEATCWAGKDNFKFTSELIEIGAVKVVLDDKLVEFSEFQTFVKPLNHPELSDFCTKLTSITQANVDSAPLFEEAIRAFVKWIDEVSFEKTTLLSWGHYDKKKILSECEEKSCHSSITEMLKEDHISLKHTYSTLKNMKPIGMNGALRQLGLKLDGTHHRGIDDARNITKIFLAIYPEWKAFVGK